MVDPSTNVVYCPRIGTTIQLSSFVEVNTSDEGTVVCQLKGIVCLPTRAITLRMRKYLFCSYVKIVVRYSRFLLHFNKDGIPVSPPSSDFLDLLLHFPKDKILATEEVSDLDDSTCDNNDDDVDMVEHLEEEIISIASGSSLSKQTSSAKSSMLVSSQKTSADKSLASYFNVGTCFRMPLHGTVWQMKAVLSDHVEAEVINPGSNSTLDCGTRKTFMRNHVMMREGLLEFNS